MQEKTCPICNETYYKFIDYCFRDGAKLVSPGEEVETEDTELLSQVQKIQHVDTVKPKQPEEDDTGTFELSIEKSNVVEEAEVIDEDLEDPMAMGNTKMFSKGDLLAMFHDDSTYNGELIDPEEDTVTFEVDETEDMEATETFDLTNRNNEEKTEFEKSTAPLPVIDDVTPIVASTHKEVQVETIQSPPKSIPTPQPSAPQKIEKEPSVSPLLLMGGLLGLVFVVVGFLFFYQNQTQQTQVIVPPPQKKAPIQQQVPPEPKEQAEEKVEPPPEEVKGVDIVEENEEDVEAIPSEPTEENVDLSAEEPSEELSNILELRVKVGQKFIPISVPESIEEKELIEKLKEIGIVFEDGTTTKISFLNQEFTEQVVVFPLPKDSPFYPVIDFNFGKEE